MKKRLLALFVIGFLVKASYAQTDSVFYHHSKFKSQYGASGGYPSMDYYRYATRFTPPYYPAQLVGLKAWFRNAANPSSFKTVVYKDPSGAKNGPVSSTPDYISANAINNPATGGFTDSAYSYYDDLTSQNIIVAAGDVYAGVTQHPNTNGFVGAAIDTSNALGTQDRPWAYYGVWAKMVSYCFVDGEWGFTAYFKHTATSVNELNNTLASVDVFPQPAREDAYVSYELKENASVSISVMNSVGEMAILNVVSKESQSAGNYTVSIPVGELSNGIYFVRLETNGAQTVKKLVVIR